MGYGGTEVKDSSLLPLPLPSPFSLQILDPYITSFRTAFMKSHDKFDGDGGLPVVVEPPIPRLMWIAAALVTCQSFLFGYIFCALNACLVVGDQKKSSACYDGSDPSCPVGSIYNDLDLDTGTNICVSK